ncbi:MAG: TonB family protein [Janthinobacterium lividum]
MTTLALLLALVAPPKLALDTTFYDGSWRHVSRANAVYYGWVTPLDSGRCRIQDFYRSGEQQMEGNGWLGPPVVKDGPVTYYFRSGAQRTTGQFANGKHEGVWQYWNEDGSLRQKITWHAGSKVLVPHTYVILIGDSNVPQLVEQMPKFLGPLSVAQYLRATVRRPAHVPAGGDVYVQFVVGPQGNITSTRIVRGLNPACDAEALRAVAALPRWQPGYQYGQPTAVRFTVPVSFR